MTQKRRLVCHKLHHPLETPSSEIISMLSPPMAAVHTAEWVNPENWNMNELVTDGLARTKINESNTFWFMFEHQNYGGLNYWITQ